MEVLKEFDKFERLASFGPPSATGNSAARPSTVSQKPKSKFIPTSLDSLAASLQELKQRIEAGEAPSAVLAALPTVVEREKKEVDERLKELYSALAKFGKSLDKKFSNSLPESSPLFTSAQSVDALERVIALHFIRSGTFDVADVFIQESGTVIKPEITWEFTNLHRILTALRAQDIEPALKWVEANRLFLHSRASPLEFHLHRSQYMRLLLASNPPDIMPAIMYHRKIFPPLYPAHSADIHRLITCPIYLPLSKLLTSPYADLASPAIHFDLEPEFAKEYCAAIKMSRQLPLRVVGDIGGGGALARIEKGKKVMRERRSEWSQSDELPIEIPLQAENRYHSIFACPVSKEQATEANPPMMMACGHVVAKESLTKLSKGGSRVKCPYCPVESTANSALRVYF